MTAILLFLIAPIWQPSLGGALPPCFKLIGGSVSESEAGNQNVDGQTAGYKSGTSILYAGWLHATRPIKKLVRQYNTLSMPYPTNA